MMVMKNLISSLCYSLLFFFCSTGIVAAQNNTTTIPVNVGVVLDLDTWFGKMGLSCINMALSDLYASHPNYTTRLHLHRRNSPTDVVLTAAAGSLSISLPFLFHQLIFNLFMFH